MHSLTSKCYRLVTVSSFFREIRHFPPYAPKPDEAEESGWTVKGFCGRVEVYSGRGQLDRMAAEGTPCCIPTGPAERNTRT